MTPIQKNICVVDEQGNEYEATYPKRAKGLVKNGRARFLSENVICLACPPNRNLQVIERHGDTMSENIQRTENVNIQDVNPEQYIAYILKQIALLQSQTSYISEVIEGLAQMPNGDSGIAGSPGNIMGEAKARAYESIVRHREETNQMLIKMYLQMYNDFKSPISFAANASDHTDDINGF